MVNNIYYIDHSGVSSLVVAFSLFICLITTIETAYQIESNGESNGGYLSAGLNQSIGREKIFQMIAGDTFILFPMTEH